MVKTYTLQSKSIRVWSKYIRVSHARSILCKYLQQKIELWSLIMSKILSYRHLDVNKIAKLVSGWKFLIFISHKLNLIYEPKSVLSKKWFASEEVIIRYKTKYENQVITTAIRFVHKGNQVLFPEVVPDGTHIW